MQSLPKPLPVVKILGYYFCLKMGLTEETGIHLLVQGLLSLNKELKNWFLKKKKEISIFKRSCSFYNGFI